MDLVAFNYSIKIIVDILIKLYMIFIKKAMFIFDLINLAFLIMVELMNLYLNFIKHQLYVVKVAKIMIMMIIIKYLVLLVLINWEYFKEAFMAC